MASKKKQQRENRTRLTASIENTNYEMVRQVVSEHGFAAVDDTTSRDDDGSSAALIWHDTCPPQEVFTRIKSYQRLNHFPNTGEITRKDNLARNLLLLQRACPADIRFDFFPRSWILPAEATAMRLYADEAARRGKPKTLIYKPVNGARGEGIGLTRNAHGIPTDEALLVQEYLSQPLLVDGFKFDLRLYVLITSCDPLRVYLFDDGLVRFSTEPYKAPTTKNMKNVCMHLTNYSVNKHNETFEQTDDPSTGSKRSYAWLLSELRTQGHDIDKLERRIADTILKTIIVGLPHMFKGYCDARKIALGTADPVQRVCPSMREDAPSPSACFEILGFDIFLSKKLKPYIIEVNRAPSFSCDSQLDANIKHDVLFNGIALSKPSRNEKIRYKKQERSSVQSRLLASAGKTSSESGTKVDGEATTYHEWEKKMEDIEAKRCGRYHRIFPVWEDERLPQYTRLISLAFDAFARAKGTSSATRTRGLQRKETSSQKGKSSATHTALLASARQRPTLVAAHARSSADVSLLHSVIREKLAADYKLDSVGIDCDNDDSCSGLTFPFLMCNWVSYRQKVGQYFLSECSLAHRHQLLLHSRMAIGSIIRQLQPQFPAQAKVALRLLGTIFERLTWNRCQGLWNAFDCMEGDWAALSSLLRLSGTPSLSEQDLALLMLQIAKNALLLDYIAYIQTMAEDDREDVTAMTASPTVTSVQGSFASQQLLHLTPVSLRERHRLYREKIPSQQFVVGQTLTLLI